MLAKLHIRFLSLLQYLRIKWGAILKRTNVELELMTDINMYQFIETVMGGGVSCILQRYSTLSKKILKR